MNQHESVFVEAPRLAGSKSIFNSRQLLANARLEAARIIADAHSQAEEFKVQTQQAVRMECEAEFAELLASAERERRRIIEQSKNELIEAVIKISREVIGEKIDKQPKTIVARVERAITQLNLKSAVGLLLHPEDLAKVGKEVSQLGVSAAADSSLERGEALIVTDAERIVVSPRLQLKSIEQALKRGDGNVTR